MKVSMWMMQAIMKVKYMSRQLGCFITAVNTWVRSHLEYCIQFWSLCLMKDDLSIVVVQRGITKLIPRMIRLMYNSLFMFTSV